MGDQEHKFDDLVWKYLDESISDREFAELQRLLRTDPSRRQRYQWMVETHHGLCQREKESESVQPAKRERRSFS